LCYGPFSFFSFFFLPEHCAKKGRLAMANPIRGAGDIRLVVAMGLRATRGYVQTFDERAAAGERRHRRRGGPAVARELNAKKPFKRGQFADG